jgi:hypothetical protein
MLLIDGVKYELWTPTSEDALEQMVREHAQDIFGEEAEFFNKKRLESELGKGSVPDGFVVVFSQSSCWYIVETELSFHDVHRHIVEQHSRFIMGIGSSETKNKIVKAIYDEIDKDASRKQKLRKAIEPDEIYRFLHEVISKPPVLAIVIEKPVKGLDETLKALSRNTISDIKVVEFQTFTRNGSDSDAHAHLFEPLYMTSSPKQPPPVRITANKHTRVGRVTLQELINTGLIQPKQGLFQTYKGTRYEAEITTGGRLRLLHDNTEWPSLSAASDHITRTSTNGWVWWYTYHEGKQCLMDDLRRRLAGDQ